jgi:hypothetical protein
MYNGIPRKIFIGKDKSNAPDGIGVAITTVDQAAAVMTNEVKIELRYRLYKK